MLTPVPYTPAHMEFCDFHPQYADAASREDPESLGNVSREAWTFLDDAGNVVGIVGAVTTHAGCAYIWTFAGKEAGRHMLAITRFVQRWLESLSCVRLEATVMKDFRPGHRWMRLLGFRKETTRPMKRWDGINDFHLYARIAR
jgi:RimJ/RimL family protein N-acetyltransferase